MSTDASKQKRAERIEALLAAGENGAAETLLREAVSDDPAQTHSWNRLGGLLKARGSLGESLQAYGKAAETDGRDVISRVQIGHLFRQMSFPDDAITWYREALHLQPDDLILQLNHAIVLPVVPESAQQMERLRQRSLEHLQRLADAGRPLRLSMQPFLPHLYPLIYHDCDTRAPLELYGELFRRAVPEPRPAAGRNGGTRSRRRIGFLSGFFSQHTNSRAFEGWIRHLDRTRFSPVLIHLHDSRHDAVRSRLDACVDAVVTLAGDLQTAQQQLLDLRLDLLFFTDIGMHPMVTLLSCHRYAPVQVTGWGVPQTSGLASMDAYISGDMVEPEAAQAHYSEPLIRVPGLPCCYLSDLLSHPARSRQDFGLPADAPLVGCPQTLWKLHPRFDAYLEGIARRVPGARFVFVEADVSSYNQLFLERLQRTAPAAWERRILLPRMERADFIALVAQLDLLLDPPNVSSGILMFDSLHTGTPIVAMEGPYLRSRFVAGTYRLMGLDHPPIARDREHYVEIAVQLLEDGDALARLSAQIRERARSLLYDRTEGLRAFEAFAEEAIARAGATGATGPLP